VERLSAAALALIGLAVVIPDLFGGREQGFHWWALVAHGALACAFLAFIVIGQRHSRTLRIAGWVFLSAWAVLILGR